MAILLHEGENVALHRSIQQHYLCAAPSAPETFISGSILLFSQICQIESLSESAQCPFKLFECRGRRAVPQGMTCDWFL